MADDPTQTFNARISVIVATYNRADLLPQTLDSVLNQSFKDFEVIVVDDGSADHTRQVIERYRGKVTYVFQENQGPAAARNHGARLAKGAWLAFQDSDDLSSTDHLETLLDHVTRNPQVAMVFANGDYMGKAFHNRQLIIPAEKSRQLAARAIQLPDLFDKSIFRLQAALISKSCYDRVGGMDESLRICHDLDLAFKIWAQFPIAYLDKVVFSYRKEGQHISSDQKLRLMENIRVIERLAWNFPDAKRLLGQRKLDNRLAYRYYRLAKFRMQEGHSDDAWNTLSSAVALAPANPKYRFYQLLWKFAAGI